MKEFMEFDDFFDFMSSGGNSPISPEQFDLMVDKFGLKPITYVLYFDHDKMMMSEEWESIKNKDIKANRIYEFNIKAIKLVKKESRLDVLNDAIKMYVECEDYENAAIVRDTIELIKAKMDEKKS